MIHEVKGIKRLWCYECKNWINGLGPEMRRHEKSVIHARNKEANLEYQNKTAKSRNKDDKFYKRLYELRDHYGGKYLLIPI